MEIIYLIIAEKDGKAVRIETEYSTDLEDYAFDFLMDGFEIETYKKEESDIHFQPFNL